MKKNKLYLLFGLFIFFIVFAVPNNVFAAQTCYYHNVTVDCGNTPMGNLTDEKCTARIELSVVDNAVQAKAVLVSGNVDKWYHEKLNQTVNEYDKSEELTISDFANGNCPEIVVQSVPAAFGYMDILIRKKPALTEDIYHGYAQSQGTTSSDACGDLNNTLSPLKQTAEEMFRSVQEVSSTIDNNENIDNTSLNASLKSLVQKQNDIQKIYTTLKKQYGSCDGWDEQIAAIETTMDAINTSLSGIQSRINDNDNISDENKQVVNEVVKNWTDFHTNYENPDYLSDEGKLEVNCGLLDPQLVEDLQTVFNIIRIIVPILLILLGSYDFGKAVLSGDNDALKKATNTFVKRCIAAVIVFFLPTIINIIFDLAGLTSNDPLCNIR